MPRLFDEEVGIIAAIEIGVLLGPDDADGGERLSVDQIFLIGAMPAHHWFRSAKGAAIFLISAEVMPPRLDAASEAVEHPKTSFGRGLGRKAESRPAGLIHGHAFRDEFIPTE